MQAPPFIPTRAAGFARLAAFIPHAGADYADRRNHDLPGHPHVSCLSPWLRHRLLTEAEVLQAATRAHGPAADRWVAQVLWRTYWKGWLELRPGVWAAYRQGLRAALNRVAVESGLRREWEAACRGETGIDCMDHWAQEIVATGYLHNHARMWFASIWIFTLRLPWELGADFFLRHLVDGDAASNTLSWRWVGGLQTPGKTYLAIARNIAEFTGGRFAPKGLAALAPPLSGPPAVPPVSAPRGDHWDPDTPAAILLHEDDLAPWFLPDAHDLAILDVTRSPLTMGGIPRAFTGGAFDDAAGRLGCAASRFDGDTLHHLADWAADTGARQLVTPYAPQGPVADALATLAPLLAARGVALRRVLRPFDRALWQHATAGFFPFRAAVGPASVLT
jgi:deoxyribodipyrimidine photo-lyase